jgi:hypothetical protein
MPSNHIGIIVRSNEWLPNRAGRFGCHQVIRELKTQGIEGSFAARGRKALDRLVVNEGPKTLKPEL